MLNKYEIDKETKQKKEEETCKGRRNLVQTIIPIIIGGTGMVGACLALPEAVYASSFDVDKIGPATVDKVVKIIKDNYGSFVVAFGAIGSFLAEGDLRSRAIGFGKYAILSGLVMAGAKAGYNIT